MDFTDFTFRVLLIFLPGIITTVLINRNTGTKEETSIQFFMRALMYGFISYYILMFIYFLLNLGIIIVDGFNSTSLLHLKFFDVMNDTNAKMDFTEIFLVSIISVIVACIKSSYINICTKMDTLSGAIQEDLKPFEKIFSKYHKFWVNKNVFTESSTPDVWYYLFTSLNHMITVRDWENNLAYVGTLRLCSRTHINAELYLEDVTIADMTGKTPIRKVTAVYLCKDNANSWDIEFMFMDTNEVNYTSENITDSKEKVNYENSYNTNNVNITNTINEPINEDAESKELDNNE